MKRFFFILFIISCAPKNPIKHSEIQDSLEKSDLSKELDSIRASMTIRTDNIKLNAELDSANKLIDKYQLIIRTEQPDELELQILKAKISKLKKSNTILINNINSINKKNEDLHDSILLINNKIQSQQEHLDAIAIENAKLQESLKNRHENFRPFLSSVSVTPCEFVRSKPVLTYLARDVKRIEIRYTANPNPKDTDKKHIIKTYFKGTVSTLVYKNDIDYPELIALDNVQVFKPGDYLIKITIDDEQCYLSTLTLK